MKQRALLRRWLLTSLGVFFLLLIAGVGGVWFLSQPVDRQSVEPVAVVVPPGSSGKKIGSLLKEKNLIRSGTIFQFFVWKDGLLKKLQAGTFMLQRSMSTAQVAQELTQGTNDVWVTIPEGLRAEEIGALLEEKLEGFNRTEEAYQEECVAYEGFLFPETYLLPRLYTATQACRLLRQEYGRQVPMELREAIHQAGKTEEEVITLASIVQREAKRPADMKIVAGILWKRVEIGMPLQVDATLQYIRGYDEKQQKWWPVPAADDKLLNSPYNTYQNPGLPPGPISNPGIDAIMAAIYPEESPYLFYISNSDGSRMYYAETFDEHRQNIVKFLN